jgi:hypothetical protein
MEPSVFAQPEYRNDFLSSQLYTISLLHVLSKVTERVGIIGTVHALPY